MFGYNFYEAFSKNQHKIHENPCNMCEITQKELKYMFFNEIEKKWFIQKIKVR